MLSPGSADLTLLSILEGPKGAIGAALGGGIACAGYLLATRRSVPRYADAMLPAAFAGYVVARLGCLLEGCCFGTVSNVLWAVHYPAGSAAYIHQLAAGWIAPDAPQSLAVHPIGGYHMAAGSVLAFATWRVRMWPGWPLACALIGYGALRVVLGTWRGGDAAWALGLAADQWAGMGLLVAGLVVASSVHVKTNVV
jgi:phosphatidylglycerol:prolipoprotein diacylglycerol transferase